MDTLTAVAAMIPATLQTFLTLATLIYVWKLDRIVVELKTRLELLPACANYRELPHHAD